MKLDSVLKFYIWCHLRKNRAVSRYALNCSEYGGGSSVAHETLVAACCSFTGQGTVA